MQQLKINITHHSFITLDGGSVIVGQFRLLSVSSCVCHISNE